MPQPHNFDIGTITKWNYPTTIYHGKKSILLIPELLQKNQLNNPLIITDNFLATTKTIASIIDNFKKNKIKYNLFSDLSSDPDEHTVYKAVKTAKTNKNDTVIIIGGGSSLDLGKTVALMAQHNHNLWSFEDGTADYINLDNKLILPSIAVPTTAGTGSEVGRVAVIIDNSTIKKKRFIFHPYLIPNWVLLDPELTVSMPAKLTAATAMDALTHALEAYWVNSYHPIADGIAVEAVKLINNNIIQAYTNPDDLTARSNLLTASTMAATAFQKGLGAVHSLSHPIGALYKVHHGLLNAIFLPYVLQLNQEKIANKLAYLAKILELNNSKDSVLKWILELREKLAIPHSLSELQLDLDHSSKDIIIKEALADPSTPSNPVKLSYENLAVTLENSLKGY